MLLPGVITILCHGDSFFAPTYFGKTANEHFRYIADWEFADGQEVLDLFKRTSVESAGPPPKAENDFATTPEETPVTIDILSNDSRGKKGRDNDDDDDDNDSSQIDPSTVDLRPEENGIQSSYATDHGTYSADDGGLVTFVPVENFFGSTSIRYTVRSKANETSNRAMISLEVTNVNDAPAIMGAGQTTIGATAGQPITVTLEDLLVTDPDNALSELVLTVLAGDHYTHSGTTVTPDAGFSGQLPIQVQVSDGAATSEAFTLNLDVAQQQSQRPVITGQQAVTTPEDEAIAIISDHLQVNDPDNTWPADFTIQVGTGDNYTVSGQTITPALNFSGTLSVPVTVNDGESTSEAFALQVSVTAINDRPTITGQQPDPLTTGQNQPLSIGLGNLLVADPDHAFPAEFTLTILEGDNYTVSGQSVTPAPGFSGPLSVNVTANDPVESSDPYGVRVSVAANAPPVITGQTALATSEEIPLSISLSNILVSDPDNSYPSGFTFMLQSGSNYTVDGEVITPVADFAGTLSVPVTVNDGSNESAPFNLQITVTGINDAPTITGQTTLATPENQAISIELTNLAITDPDNETFTLSILAGDNYTVSGNQVTPATGFNGDLTVRVFVSDGTANSNIFDLVITVNPVNDPPVITGQRAIEIPEGTSIALSLTDVTVTDSDNTFPDGFTLAVQPGENYTVSGTTVTPAPHFAGPLYVTVTVSDGVNNSVPFSLLVTMIAVNDAPVITGQQAVSTGEETPRAMALADLIVSDPDNNFPEGFTLLVFPGINYTLDGNTVVPATDYSGTLTVQVQVSDGSLTSNIFDVAMQVTAVNDKPVITGQLPVQTAEDVPVTIQLSQLSVLDSDNVFPAGFTLTVSPGANYTVSGTTVQPAIDFNGTLNASIMVNDGTSNSDPFTFQIQVGNANDAPLITGQTPVSTNEETPVTLSLSNLTVVDPDNAFPTGFSLLVSPGTNYTVSGETITPAVNFAGVLSIPVRVNDGVNNSATFDFQLQVNQVNDPPSFAALDNQQLAENSPAGSVTITGISKGPMEDDQELTFVATSSNTSVIEDPVITYDGSASTAVLSFVVKPNASGVVTLTIVAIDNGSNVAPNQNSYSSGFQVEVLEINTPPTLDVISNITIMEDAEQQNVPLSGITAGAGETQSISVAVTTTKPEFFDLLEVAYMSPAASGLLQLKTKPNVSGTVDISIVVTDNGSGVAPHVNTITRTFSVLIQPVNDPPVFASEPVTVAAVGEEYQYNIIASDPDAGNLVVSALVKPSWAALTLSGTRGEARLHGKPPAGSSGDFDVTLQAKDATSAVEQTFVIYVNVRPSITTLSLVTEEDTTVVFPSGFFAGGYSDPNDNPLTQVQITSLPASGRLSLPAGEVKAGDTIPATSLSQLRYTPNENFFGPDSFGWNAYDGYHFTLKPARVNISVLPINDPPRIVLPEDTLRYEVNGEPALLSPLADIVDPDDDTLTHASIGFVAQGYRPQYDVLEFQSTGNIRGSFNLQTGMLELTGIAPLTDYRTVLQSIRYLHQNTLDPILETKGVTFVANDGKTEGDVASQVILLQYTFIEFEIPSGFTPNGDQANDTWVIDRPGGGLEEMDNAIISVYNKQGVLVYRARGFDRPWDGTMNGETLPADTYFFTIDLQLRNKKTYKGIVTILR